MKGKPRPPGELRQSQVITTFGPGAMVDLPRRSVLIGGLDFWHGPRRRIFEDRLAAKICEKLELSEVALYEPPLDDPDPQAPRTGITTFLFPTWFLAQVDQTFEDVHGKRYRTRPLVPWGRLVKSGYLTEDKKVVPVVPVRFVQACIRGHIGDIDWQAFVHRDFDTKQRGPLWLDEGGSGSDLADIFVRSEVTGERRPLSDAAIPGKRVLGYCLGRSPWLGPKVREECQEHARLLVRSASNAYFAQTLSVIAIPDAEEKLRKAVDQVYEDFLQYAESLEDLQRERKKQKVFVALEGLGDDAVWDEVRRRKSGELEVQKSIKQVEIETLLSQPDAVGEDMPEGDFYARTRAVEGIGIGLRERVDRIVLLHRLREVIAQVGFTRFEPALPDIDGELSLPVTPAPLARETTWVPAVENRGEGVCIAFRPEAIDAWIERPEVLRRGTELERGFEAWKNRKEFFDARFPGLPYILLHSLSHLLITAVSLECGYAASSIRERVYAGDSGYAILLYTGSSGSEGTLGGLVHVGAKIEHHLRRALELGRLCSNDPVCAQHDPASPHEERFLHGAACHGCLLIAETSCERRNELLDRELVVPTVLGRGAEFFRAEAQ
jgi:uncharacterized protein DUF1998